MIIFKGDEVKLKSGETGVVIDTWGIVRTWCKVKINENKVVYIKTNHIDSIIKRDSGKRRTWG